MVVLLLIVWLGSTVPHTLHTICLPCSLAVQLLACLSVRLLDHLLASPLLYLKMEREHLSVNCSPYDIPVVFHLQYFCVQFVRGELE